MNSIRPMSVVSLFTCDKHFVFMSDTSSIKISINVIMNIISMNVLAVTIHKENSILSKYSKHYLTLNVRLGKTMNNERNYT